MKPHKVKVAELVQCCPLQLGSLHKDLNGLSLYVHAKGDQYVSKAIAESGIWEAYETQLLVELLEPDSCFVDVGANIGYYTAIASRLLDKTGCVLAFEPEPRNFSVLHENCAKRTNVTCINAGLAATAGDALIYLSQDNWGDHQIYDAGLTRDSTRIALLKGDDFLAQQFSELKRVKRIDVLKIDTQGAEMKVLKGLEATIRASLPTINIIIEFWPFGLRKSGDHAHQVLDFLLSLNLPMAIIDHLEHGLIPCQEADLRPWIDDLDKDSSNEGFMNLLLGNTLLK